MKALKLIAVTLALTIGASALAAPVTGRATMRLRPDFGRGSQQFIEVREEGGKILGLTFVSANSMVSLSYDENRWGGAAGGLTNFSDTAAGADGIVASLPYHTKAPVINEASSAATLNGTINMNGFDFSVTPQKLTLNSIRGFYELTLSGTRWLGQGSLRRGPQVWKVELELTGSLANLPVRDPALFVALFGTPFVR